MKIQYGFRAAHSSEHAIGQVISGIVKGLENKLNSACVLLDLLKAFDTIEHGIMLEKTIVIWYTWKCLIMVQKLSV